MIRRSSLRIAALMHVVLLMGTRFALAQGAAPAPPPEPPKPWMGSIASGLAVTGGNADTLTTNLSFDLQSDKTKVNVFKAEGLNLRSSKDGESIVDRTSLAVRDEYKVTARSYVFGQFQYLRDVFKAIDYLMAPTGGVGLKVVDTDRTVLNVDGSVGAVVEKNPGVAKKTSGAVVVGEKFQHKVTPSATFTETFGALWKTKDVDDSLYTFGVGLAAAENSKVQLKFEFLDTYKNKPPSVLIKKNDTALVTSIVYKF